MKSITRAAAIAISAAFIFGCSSKQTKDQVNGADGNLTSQISNQPLNYQLEGSDTGKIDGLNTIHFDYDQALVRKDDQQTLKNNAKWIKAHPEDTIQIEGHCDQRGTSEYNLALGERRAKAVKQQLVRMGISSKHMTTISYGEERPIDPGDSDEAYAKNRRANFVPVKSPGTPLAGNH